MVQFLLSLGMLLFSKYRKRGKIRWAKLSQLSSLLQKFFRELLAIGK